ncbi:MAG: hypothetical protein ACREEY_18200 [Brevundimonas sp.]
MTPPLCRETPTGLPGFRLWPGALDAAAQGALLAELLAATETAPAIGSSEVHAEAGWWCSTSA